MKRSIVAVLTLVLLLWGAVLLVCLPAQTVSAHSIVESADSSDGCCSGQPHLHRYRQPSFDYSAHHLFVASEWAGAGHACGRLERHCHL